MTSNARHPGVKNRRNGWLGYRFMRRLANKPPKPNRVPITRVLGSGTGAADGERETYDCDSPGLADTGGLNARDTSKPPTVAWASLPARTLTDCNIAGRMPTIHKKPLTVEAVSKPPNADHCTREVHESIIHRGIEFM